MAHHPVNIDDLLDLAKEATQHLQLMEAESLRKLADISVEHVQTRTRIADSEIAYLVETSCHHRTLVHDHRLLLFQTQLLANEHSARLDGRDQKLQQLYARMQSHLELIQSCLAILQQKAG
jgi:hypothetical protein